MYLSITIARIAVFALYFYFRILLYLYSICIYVFVLYLYLSIIFVFPYLYYINSILLFPYWIIIEFPYLYFRICIHLYFRISIIFLFPYLYYICKELMQCIHVYNAHAPPLKQRQKSVFYKLKNAFKSKIIMIGQANICSLYTSLRTQRCPGY